MTDNKPTQGNIVDAIKALQQGARVWGMQYGANMPYELVIRLSNEELVIAGTGVEYRVQEKDIRDDAFRIEWPKPRTPKRGEVWGDSNDNLILACTPSTVVIAWSMKPNRVEVVSNFNIQSVLTYRRDATPEEMTQFDGGDSNE